MLVIVGSRVPCSSYSAHFVSVVGITVGTYLNSSLQGAYIGEYIWGVLWVIKGDTRGVGYSSYTSFHSFPFSHIAII